MAAASDNKYDVFNWILKVIDSCNTVQQIHNVDKLIQLFKMQADNPELHKKLVSERYDKIHRILAQYSN
jgi:hypothetical protein